MDDEAEVWRALRRLRSDLAPVPAEAAGDEELLALEASVRAEALRLKQDWATGRGFRRASRAA